MAESDHYYRRNRVYWAGKSAQRLHGQDGSSRKVFDSIYELLAATKRQRDEAAKARVENDSPLP